MPARVTDSELDEPLIPQAYTEVVSPSTLPGGYTFVAEADGRSFTVTVPPGGVEQGQSFKAPIPAGADSGAPAPPARWKDGLCDCFKPGCCHASVCCAIWCPLVFIGQIMNRLEIDWLGALGSFRALLAISIFYYVASWSMGTYIAYLQLLVGKDGFGNVNTLPSPGPLIIAVDSVIDLLFGATVLILVCLTRERIRDRDGIPEESCGGCEDCCCACWCKCCALAQMARQTSDYDKHMGVCCSETGLPPDAAGDV